MISIIVFILHFKFSIAFFERPSVINFAFMYLISVKTPANFATSNAYGHTLRWLNILGRLSLLISMAYEKEWAVDMDLKCDLQKYVNQNLRRSEIVDFVKRDYRKSSI